MPRPSVACPSYFSSSQGPSRHTEHSAAPYLPGSVLYPAFMILFIPGNIFCLAMCVCLVLVDLPCHVFSLGSLPLNSSCLVLCAFFLPEPMFICYFVSDQTGDRLLHDRSGQLRVDCVVQADLQLTAVTGHDPPSARVLGIHSLFGSFCIFSRMVQPIFFWAESIFLVSNTTAV